MLAQEILLAARRAAPRLGIATVYRNIRALVELGELQPLSLPGQTPRYELVGHHHHHFVCRACERVFPMSACPGNLSQLAPPAFVVEDHELTLYGRCAQCAPVQARHVV